jgi:hypothetical protein
VAGDQFAGKVEENGAVRATRRPSCPAIASSPRGEILPTAKRKNPLREQVSKRVGFAGIRNRNRNRVSRPPAILRVFNGSGSVSFRTGCASRRSSSVEWNLRQAEPALRFQERSLRVSSTYSRPTLIKQRELDATNSDPAPIQRTASANVGFEGHKSARFSRQRFVELPTQDHASFAVVGCAEDRGTAR